MNSGPSSFTWMGGPNRSHLRERVLDGVTRQVLAQMTVPVPMAH
jgi:nucleotide-binding universal stress UspA family protein